MAIAATAQWDVRTTGNDSNGGAFDPAVASPGTDFSQQNSAQVVFTDLVIGATTTQLTSAGSPFSSTSPGNFIHITGGTGFTVGWYEILSVSGITATMDRAVGTAASIGGTGNLGGSLLTVGQANTNVAQLNTVWVQSGTYTITTTISLTVAYFMNGYATTHGDLGAAPLITSSTNSLRLFSITYSGSSFLLSFFTNIKMSSTATTRGEAFHKLNGNAMGLMLARCTLDGFNIAINGNDAVDWHIPFVCISATEIKNSISHAIQNNTGSVNYIINGSYIHNNGGSGYTDLGFSTASQLIVGNSIIASNSAFGITMTSTSTSNLNIYSSTIANNTSGGVVVGSVASPSTQIGISIINSIFYGNGTYGVNLSSSALAIQQSVLSYANAYGANTTAAKLNFVDLSPVTLTASPFTNSGTGDYSLNSASGGGLLVKGFGLPGVFAGGTSTGHLDIGAAQSAAGSGSNLAPVVTLGMSGGIRG